MLREEEKDAERRQSARAERHAALQVTRPGPWAVKEEGCTRGGEAFKGDKIANGLFSEKTPNIPRIFLTFLRPDRLIVTSRNKPPRTGIAIFQ